MDNNLLSAFRLEVPPDGQTHEHAAGLALLLRRTVKRRVPPFKEGSLFLNDEGIKEEPPVFSVGDCVTRAAE